MSQSLGHELGQERGMRPALEEFDGFDRGHSLQH